MQGVVVVQSLVGLGKTVPGQIPNPERAVGHDPHFGGVRQTVALGLGKSGSRRGSTPGRVITVPRLSILGRPFWLWTR